MKFRSPSKVLLNVKEVLGELTCGEFLERENRFVCRVSVNGEERRAHLSDTGRLKELFRRGAPLVLSSNPKGKLDYKLIAVKSDGEWVFLNPSLHSKIAESLIKGGFLGFLPESVEREVSVGRSRIDFLIDGNFYLEVKGCNLVKGGICLFPDAPTERGRKHLLELVELREKGFRAGVLFLSFRDCVCFSPNSETDLAFCDAFKRALLNGVEYYGFRLGFSPERGEVFMRGKLELCKEGI